MICSPKENVGKHFLYGAFMNTSDLVPIDGVEHLKAAEQLLNCIPPDIDPVSLIGQLDQVFQLLSSVNLLQAEIFVETKISVRFKLDKSVTRSIVSSIRKLSKANHAAATRDLEPQKPVESSMSFPGLVDVLDQDGKSVYLIKSDEGIVSVSEKYELDLKTLVPDRQKELPYLLPRAEYVGGAYELYWSGSASVKEVDEALYDDVLSYLQASVVLPDPDYYHLYTAWIFHTYLMEYFDYSPILSLLGQPETGKSRLGCALVNASFRGIHQESLTAAQLTYLGSYYRPTLFIDVKDLRQKVRGGDCLDQLLLSGERGMVTPKVTSFHKGSSRKIDFHKSFVAKIIATNVSYDDSAFNSRTLCFRMPPLRQHVPFPAATQEVALPLRERLVAFRARHLFEELPEYVNTYHGRLGDITDPIFQIIDMVKPGARGCVERTIDKLTNDALACLPESADMRILRVVYNFALSSQENFITVKEIWQHVNGIKEGFSALSPESIGRRLAALGFDMYRTGDNTSAIRFNRFWLSDLLSRYGI